MAEEGALDEDVLIREAIEATGLSNFGGDGFRDGLRMLVETYRPTISTIAAENAIIAGSSVYW